MLRFWLGLAQALAVFLHQISASAQQAAWLDGDPAAIWQRPPGFYQEGSSWYAIVHTRPEITRVRLAGDFTDNLAGALDLTRTPTASSGGGRVLRGVSRARLALATATASR